MANNPSFPSAERLAWRTSPTDDAHQPPCRSLDDLSREVQRLFEQPLEIESLLTISQKLQSQLREGLISSTQCMLPSHHYQLPSGQETGVYLAVEVGGSNLQVAVVELHGQDVNHGRFRVSRLQRSPIEANVKELGGLAFFDWIAQKIKDMLDGDADHDEDPGKRLQMGLAWSFPLELVYRWGPYAIV
jgi:hexokinase